jgi:hypothetical protein
MKRVVGIVVVVAGLLVMLLIFGGFEKWMDHGYNAWAYANPPLMQTWAGDAVAGTTRLKMTLALKRDEVSFLEYGDGDTQDTNRTVSGQAMLCDSSGRRQCYPVSGVVKDRRAAETLLIFSVPANEAPGLRPERMRLSWDGRANLTGEAELAHALAGGGTRISSADPETGHAIAFQFHPAGDAGCAAP